MTTVHRLRLHQFARSYFNFVSAAGKEPQPAATFRHRHIVLYVLLLPILLDVAFDPHTGCAVHACTATVRTTFKGHYHYYTILHGACCAAPRTVRVLQGHYYFTAGAIYKL
jgi:hypothetical protein